MIALFLVAAFAAGVVIGAVVMAAAIADIRRDGHS